MYYYNDIKTDFELVTDYPIYETVLSEISFIIISFFDWVQEFLSDCFFTEFYLLSSVQNLKFQNFNFYFCEAKKWIWEFFQKKVSGIIPESKCAKVHFIFLQNRQNTIFKICKVGAHLLCLQTSKSMITINRFFKF